ncbi:unnamed protein product [Effrenium voratum]|uniref:Uncharacterized protein n=1 Tax=Effrenium voratum TaxID=2562239 RepID=A0AA36JJT5_9DINO|nr:unnamed protein product [Effrenium voratum]
MQEEQLEALQAEEQKNLCFEWERTGRCRRNGCRFDHPAPKPEDAKEVEAKESQWGNGWSWGDGWAEGSWSSAPLGAVHGHTSRAELEKGRREKKEAWAQEKNKRQAMQDMKRLANMDARVVLARRMRELISKALNLGAEYAEAKGEVEDVTDLEAAALAQLRAWGFKASAADAALLAARDAGGFGDEAADEAAERLRVWLCLHLPEHELPEAFAAGKGQFEVKAGRGAAPGAAEVAATAPETAAAARRREFFGWVREALDAAMEDESAAEAMFASVEVVLEDDPGRTEEEEQEALDSALELMSAEGVQEPTLEEMRTRWGALRALAAAEASAVAEEAEAEAEASDGSEALGDHEEPEVVAEVEAPRPKPKGGTWFGWKADAAPKEVAAWKASGKGQKMQKAREALPAFKVKEELRQLLSSNQVLLIHGETGSGKTTQVGQYLLDSDTATPPRVVVTQPRRFAAVSVARRVAEERGEVVGENSVGYMVRGDTKMRYDRCQLLFCTLGVLLRRLIAQGEEEMFRTQDMTHLVLDEVHERSLDMDFVLTLLHHILPKRPKLKVLLMSATMDVQSLARLFSQKPPVLKIPGRTFPVEVMHLEEVEDLLGSTYQWSASAGKGWEGSEANERGDRKRDARPGPMDYALLADFILTLADGGQAKPWPEGAILVFMPGAGEISRLISTLERKGGRNVKALPLHGSLSGEQQRRCFEVYPASGPRKVIVSTNVAETSVTLPDVTIVVDTCRERRLTRDHDHTSLAPALLERFCAKDSLQQRRGRAGRVQKGVCFRPRSCRRPRRRRSKLCPWRRWFSRCRRRASLPRPSSGTRLRPPRHRWWPKRAMSCGAWAHSPSVTAKTRSPLWAVTWQRCPATCGWGGWWC